MPSKFVVSSTIERFGEQLLIDEIEGREPPRRRSDGNGRKRTTGQGSIFTTYFYLCHLNYNIPRGLPMESMFRAHSPPAEPAVLFAGRDMPQRDRRVHPLRCDGRPTRPPGLPLDYLGDPGPALTYCGCCCWSLTVRPPLCQSSDFRSVHCAVW